MRENLIAALKDADTNADNMQIDQIAWLIGMFPGNDLRNLCQGCPRIEALLPEMDRKTRGEALMAVANYMDRENHLGRVADKIRKFA